MKRKKATLHTGKRGFTNGVDGTNGKKVAPAKSTRRPVFRQPKTELEQAIQRYIDLFDFAPIGYVTFDRVGRIEEINFAAIRLLRRSRRQLIGTTFAICVAKEETQLFLNHLRDCRSSDSPVVTELNLTRADGGKIPVLLSSTATLSLMKDGARLYQTAIFDLTERKAADAALREKDAELELIVTQTPFMLTRCSRDLRYRYVSRAYAMMLGRTPEEIAGKPIAEIMGKEALKAISPHIETVLKGHTVEYQTEVSIQGVGAPYLHCVYSPDRDAKGTVIGWFGSIVDITEQKRTEQVLAETALNERALSEFVQHQQEARTIREIYAAALDAILTALRCDRASILLFDAKDVMRFVDWRDLSARYRKEVEGHSPWKANVPDPQPVCIANVDSANLPRRLKSVIEAEGIHAVAFIPLIVEGKLIGKFMAYYNAPHDFTNKEIALALSIAYQLALGVNRKGADEALRESHQRLQATYERASIGISECSAEGKYIGANEEFSRMLGYTKDEILQRGIKDVTHKKDYPHEIKLYRQLVQGEIPFYRIEKRFVRKDGSIIWTEMLRSIVRDSEGAALYTIGAVRDVTQAKEAQAALQKSKELLEQRVRERTHDLLVANKELKSEIERRKGLEGEILSISDREQQRLGQELHDGLCQHLTAVAFMARSVALRLKNHRVIEVSDIEKIAELVNEAAADMRNLSRALHRSDVDAAKLVDALEDLADREIWKVPCRLEIKPSFHIEDDTAAAQLYRIAREAVINANKHAQARKIVVSLERSSKEMVLRVTDDGIGFSNRPQLKQGLGTHIMSYRAQLMGGRLEIDSPRRGGTRLSCYLPNKTLQSGKGEDALRLPAKITKALSVLI
jgi:PAS domain S-box-containing protein